MNERHYVLQYNRYHGECNNWETVSRRYDTYEEAEAARQKMPAPSCYRVAESYTVTRYKAVKK